MSEGVPARALATLNYHHLRYFHAVARTGSVVAASEALAVSPSTVSAQVKSLEAELGHTLLRRSGRALTPTQVGQAVLGYADQIFDLGDALLNVVQSEQATHPLRIGVSRALPKLLLGRLLGPALTHKARPIVQDGDAEDLLTALHAGQHDVLFVERTHAGTGAARATTHPLATLQMGAFGSAEMAALVAANGAARVPWLVPPRGATARQGLERWWRQRGWSPPIAGVVSESALLKSFAAAGHGLIAAPVGLKTALRTTFGLGLVEELPGLTERVFAITRESEPTSEVVLELCRPRPLLDASPQTRAG